MTLARQHKNGYWIFTFPPWGLIYRWFGVAPSGWDLPVEWYVQRGLEPEEPWRVGE